MKINKNIVVLGLVATMLLGLTACGGTKADNKNTPEATNPAGSVNGTVLSGKLVIEGSTSMQKIFQELGDTYSAKNSKVDVQYIGDGSSAGIKAAIGDTANIGTASREVKEEEASQGLEVIKVAEDAIVVIVNNENGVKDLSKEQIAKIYKKEITNWKDVGGKDAPIVVVARDAASGTREAFESLFDVKDKVQADQEAAKTGEVKTIISQNPNAIGYISLAYADKMVKSLTVEGMVASTENVLNGTYTIKRPFNIVTKGKPDELEKAFIDFIFTEEGKAIISKEAVPVSR